MSSRLPFPVSPTTYDPSWRETDSLHSTSSSLDLFAGPRTSLQYDTQTGEIISAAHDVSDMDALVGTLRDSALPPELRNMRRETKDRQRLLAQRDQLEKNVRSNRKKKPVPHSRFPTQPNQSPVSIFAQHEKTPGSLLPDDEPLVTPSRHVHIPTGNLLSNGITDDSTLSRSHPELPRSISLQSCNHLSPTPSKLRHPHMIDFPSDLKPPSCIPALPVDQTRIPSINEIVARYASNSTSPSTRLSQMPAAPLATSPLTPIRSIDEIIRDYGSLIHPSEPDPNYHHPLRASADKCQVSHVPLSATGGRPNTTSREREKSCASIDTQSSVDSVVEEVMRYLAGQVSTQDDQVDSFPMTPRASAPMPASHQTKSPASTRPPALRRSIYRKTSRPSFEASTPRGPLRSSKRLNGPDLEPGLDRSSSSATDERIANYLRSPRLTTLLKLKNHPNTNMTVSLADVGLSTGHPVIVFLGLGCVRYLVALYDELAEALGLRLVCIDRWGLGKTTEVPDLERGFLEWSTVVEEVTDQLNITQFSILAHSAGAPYALASSLRLDQRVRGSIHLLAPWVSMTAENGLNAGGYKWLKYLPNSMIKTAQAAEWKMQGWRLGKPPSVNRDPVGYDIRAPLSSKNVHPPTSFQHNDYYDAREDLVEEDELPHEPCDLDHETHDHSVRPSIESRLSDWSQLSSDTYWASTPAGSRQTGKGLLGKVFPSHSHPSHERKAHSTSQSDETDLQTPLSPRSTGPSFGLTKKSSSYSLNRLPPSSPRSKSSSIISKSKPPHGGHCGLVAAASRSRTISSMSDKLGFRASVS